MSNHEHFPYRRYQRYPLVPRRRRWRFHLSGDALCWLAGLAWIGLFLLMAWLR